MLFEVLNTDYKDRKNVPAYFNDFPYVNGGLFEKKLKSPTFTRKSRQAIINSGELNGSAMNPESQSEKREIFSEIGIIGYLLLI